MNKIKKEKALIAAYDYFEYVYDDTSEYSEEDIYELAEKLENECIFRYVMTKQLYEDISCNMGRNYINKAQQRKIKAAFKILNLLADIAN